MNSPKLKAEVNIDSLFPELLVKILQYLDSPDIPAARLVCKTWKYWMDSELNFKVVVNDGVVGNAAFIQTLRKKEVHVRRLKSKVALKSPRMPSALQKVTLSGPVHSEVLQQILQFQFLQDLKIEGRILTGALSVPEKIPLPHLKVLQLIAPFAPEGNMKTRSTNSENDVVRLAVNMASFLNNIRCPQIMSLKIDGDVDQTHLPKVLDWKKDELVEFLDRHKGSLKDVYIGESNILGSKSRRAGDREFPKTLRYLHCSFHGFEKNKEDIMMFDFLANQRDLEVLNFGSLFCYQTMDVLPSLPLTLRHLAIYWNEDGNRTFDCAALSRLVNLEQLELTYDGRFRTRFDNLLSLQSCKNLKGIVLERGGVPAEDLLQFGSCFPELKMLYLSWCKLQIRSESECGITIDGLLSILSMRSLEYIYCTSGDFLGDQKTIAAMKDIMRPFCKSVLADRGFEFQIGKELATPQAFNFK